MKSKLKTRLFAMLLLACLSTLAVAAAAPVVSQPSRPSRPSVGVRPEVKIVPGTLTITAPAAAATWETFTNREIAWNGMGPRPISSVQVTPLGPVDVTLWKDGQLTSTIAAGTTADHVVYTVPITMASGAYELRVTSKDFANLEARQMLTIKNVTSFGGPASTLTPPATTLGK